MAVQLEQSYPQHSSSYQMVVQQGKELQYDVPTAASTQPICHVHEHTHESPAPSNAQPWSGEGEQYHVKEGGYLHRIQQEQTTELQSGNISIGDVPQGRLSPLEQQARVGGDANQPSRVQASLPVHGHGEITCSASDSGMINL